MMIIQQRVMTARFAEKARKNPGFVKQLGVEVIYKEEANNLGGKKDEKCNYIGRDEEYRNSDI